MKFLIIGTGGTGGCIGGYLAKQGEDVTVIARGEHLKKIQGNGLSVHSARLGDFNIHPVKACTMEDYNEVPDVVFVCVKYYALAEAASFLQRAADRHTMVIPILNVYGTGSKMQQELDCTVLDGCVYIFSMIGGPGLIVQPTPIFRMFFGFRKDQRKTTEQEKRMLELEEILNRARIEAHYSLNIEKDALQKFSFVSPMGAAGLYYNAQAADFMVEGEKREMFFALVREVEAVGNAMGLTFDVDLAENAGNILAGLTPDATTSMQRDVESGGRSEADGLIHEMVRLGEKYHVAVPNYTKISQWAVAQGIK